MSEERAMFVRDGDAFVGTEATAGWWDAGAQAGGAVLGLLGHLIEDLPSLAPMSLSRLTVDLIRPVPVGRPLAVVSRIVRDGKKIQVTDMAVTCDDVEHVVARALRLRDEDVTDARGMPQPSTDANPITIMPGPDDCDGLPDGPHTPPFLRSSVELRRTSSPVAENWGIWMRPRIPVVAGEAIRATSRVTLPMDTVNLIGSRFDVRRASAINADVSAHVTRLPTDEWVLLTGNSWFGHEVGHGISVASMADSTGVFGVTSTSQLLQRIG